MRRKCSGMKVPPWVDLHEAKFSWIASNKIENFHSFAFIRVFLASMMSKNFFTRSHFQPTQKCSPPSWKRFNVDEIFFPVITRLSIELNPDNPGDTAVVSVSERKTFLCCALLIALLLNINRKNTFSVDGTFFFFHRNFFTSWPFLLFIAAFRCRADETALKF